MSMLPFSPYTVFEDPFMNHGLESLFGMALLPSDFGTDRIVPRSQIHHLPTGYRRPWSLARQALMDNGVLTDRKNLHFGKDGFQACVDVHHFKPSEVTVKTVNNEILVEGKHEERDDEHGYIQRHFVRKYILPDDYDMNSVHSSLSSDGVLTLKAPPPHAIKSGERHVPIVHSHIPVHMSVKDQNGAEKEDSVEKKKDIKK